MINFLRGLGGWKCLQAFQLNVNVSGRERIEQLGPFVLSPIPLLHVSTFTSLCGPQPVSSTIFLIHINVIYSLIQYDFLV